MSIWIRPPLARRNKYDEDIIEYWVDVLTSGHLGLRQEEGIRESSHARGSSSTMRLSSSDNLREWNHEDMGGCEIEGSPEKVFWPAYQLACLWIDSGIHPLPWLETEVTDVIGRYLQECVNTRDRLTKFMNRLDASDALVKPPPSSKHQSQSS